LTAALGQRAGADDPTRCPLVRAAPKLYTCIRTEADKTALEATFELRLLPASDPSHKQRAQTQLEALRVLVEQPTEATSSQGDAKVRQLEAAKHDHSTDSNN
jgi:hypothetical protein